MIENTCPLCKDSGYVPHHPKCPNKPTNKVKKPNKSVINVKNLTTEDRAKIFHLVAIGYPVKAIAIDRKIKYSSIRHIVFSEWERLYPEHFAKHGLTKSIDNLRSNPLPEAL